MKCCGNCEWSISPEQEFEILKEQGYEESDPNRPRAGDCCIGRQHNENYFCSSHLYIEGMEEYENYIIYDEQYLGPGYLIITKLDDEIIKFIKISTLSDSGFPYFSIRGFEKNSIDNPEENFRKIHISINKNEPLYKLICELTNNINNQKIYSINKFEHGNNCLQASYNNNEATLTLIKDVYGVKNATDFIDILLGDNNSCENYEAILNFYNELAKISTKEKIKKYKKV